MATATKGFSIYSILGAPFLIIILSFLNSIRFVCVIPILPFYFRLVGHLHAMRTIRICMVLIKKGEQCGKIKLGIEKNGMNERRRKK